MDTNLLIFLLVLMLAISGMFTSIMVIGVVAIVYGQNDIALSALDTLKGALLGVIKKIKK